MAKVQEHAPTSFEAVINIIETLRATYSGPLWYRGVGDASHQLLPSLYRHRTVKTAAELYKLELRLMTRFRQRSIPFHDRDLKDDWNAMFFMQHYGVPTRLLDWSESPYVALYFAMMDCPSKRNRAGEITYTKSNTLWILKPAIWNKHALSHINYPEEVLTPRDEGINGHRSTIDFGGMAVSPVAMYGAHNSPRIVAQRGAFTIFGQKTASMDKIYDEDKFPAGSLIKLVFAPQHIGAIKNSILQNGVSESVVFPDLTGLAHEIRREFAF